MFSYDLWPQEQHFKRHDVSYSNNVLTYIEKNNVFKNYFFDNKKKNFMLKIPFTY